jgi:hypothetical protein
MRRLMRFLLISLMLVLLPLRGWAGNTMAVDTATQKAATSVMQAQMMDTSSQTVMPADCDMHAQPPSDAALKCGSCDTCELCLAVANLTLLSWPADHLAPHTSPLAIAESFSSVARALNLKPPIF